MDSGFSLSEYMSDGIENIIKDVVKASFKNPKETAFILKYAMSSKEAKKTGRGFFHINVDGSAEPCPFRHQLKGSHFKRSTKFTTI